jgi:small basic protein (TIGR04137 family)
MSIHPSLNFSDKDKKQRSVLKRTERLRALMEKNHWKEGDNVFGLPKLKTLRIKIKKEKAAEKPEAAAAEGAAPAAAETKAPAQAKAPAAKGQEKK